MQRTWQSLTRIALALLVPAALRAQDPSTGVYELAQVETLPRPANVPEFVAALRAAYPADRSAAGQGATVQVLLVVGADGVPREARVSSSTDAAFDSVTLAAVAGLRFTPATVAGRAVPVRLEMPVQWRPAPVETAETETVASAPAAPSADGTAGEERTYELRDVDVTPQPLNLRGFRRTLERAYPAHLRSAGARGLVQVRMRIDTAGVPHDFLIVRTTDVEFNRPTLESVAQLRFRPARLDGRPVNVWVDLPIQWSVHEPAPAPGPEIGRGTRHDPWPG